MQCECGGWISVCVVVFGGKERVGLSCNLCEAKALLQGCDASPPPVPDKVKIDRVAMGRFW